jgi:hypothetical protein
VKPGLPFLLLAGSIVMGLILGLIYAWVIDPVDLINTTPDLLRVDYRHEWIRLAALGYVADRDLTRAQARLEPLPQDDIGEALTALVEAYAAQGRPAETMRSLSYLAQQLGVHTPAMDIYLGTSLRPTPPPPSPSATPIPSPTPPLSPPPATATPIVLPTPTPTPLPTPASSPYRVISQTMVCTGTAAQLRVFVQSAPVVAGTQERAGATETPQPTPLAGVVLWLTWPEGADRAVTGMRPWIDPGYVDFALEMDVPYALSVDEPNFPVLSGLMVPLCPASDGEPPQPGSWRVIVSVESSASPLR